MITLDIWSDPVCPWCMIGKAALDRAIDSRSGHPFAVRWHPFQLNPDMPREGMDRQEYLDLKFGGPEGVIKAYSPVVERAEADGVAMNLPAITRMPNTLDAHRVIHWAGLEGRQDAIVSALFDAFFRKGRDIGARGVLAEVASRHGLDRSLVERLLDSESDVADISARDRAARARGIDGVPFFVVAGTHAVPGAQPVALWQRVIDELAAPHDPHGGS